MFGRCFVRSVLCSIMDARCCVVCSVRDYFVLFDVLFESSVLFNVWFDMLRFVRLVVPQCRLRCVRGTCAKGVKHELIPARAAQCQTRGDAVAR